MAGLRSSLRRCKLTNRDRKGNAAVNAPSGAAAGAANPGCREPLESTACYLAKPVAAGLAVTAIEVSGSAEVSRPVRDATVPAAVGRSVRSDE